MMSPLSMQFAAINGRLLAHQECFMVSMKADIYVKVSASVLKPCISSQIMCSRCWGGAQWAYICQGERCCSLPQLCKNFALIMQKQRILFPTKRDLHIKACCSRHAGSLQSKKIALNRMDVQVQTSESLSCIALLLISSMFRTKSSGLNWRHVCVTRLLLWSKWLVMMCHMLEGGQMILAAGTYFITMTELHVTRRTSWPWKVKTIDMCRKESMHHSMPKGLALLAVLKLTGHSWICTGKEWQQYSRYIWVCAMFGSSSWRASFENLADNCTENLLPWLWMHAGFCLLSLNEAFSVSMKHILCTCTFFIELWYILMSRIVLMISFWCISNWCLARKGWRMHTQCMECDTVWTHIWCLARTENWNMHTQFIRIWCLAGKVETCAHNALNVHTQCTHTTAFEAWQGKMKCAHLQHAHSMRAHLMLGCEIWNVHT